ncbi:MAG: ATP-binding protein [Gemmatimonadetes bacterium]|nr:ATP-binding protein [Gemmatimonadota bacterium]
MQDTILASNRPEAPSLGRDRAGARTAAYCALAAGLFLLYLAIRHASWSVTPVVHGMLELSASIVALTVGVLALVRYYSRKNDTLLLVGAGMIGTAVLDAYHLLVTSRLPGPLSPSDPVAAELWSWFGGRVFLSLLMLWSWVAWRRERDLGARPLSEPRVFLEVGAFTLLAIALFGMVELPSYMRLDLPVPRPIELTPGVVFAIATGGYLLKGNWKRLPFEVWLVPALIVSTAIQFLFIPFSVVPTDAFGTVSYALKLVSYALIFVGLVASMYGLYRQVERSAHLIRHKNEALEAEVGVRREAEKQVRISEVKYRTILETIQEGYFEVDLAGNFVFWNDSLAEMLGYPPERLSGLNYRSYTREGQSGIVFETFGEVYRTGKSCQVFGWEIVRADGTRRFAEASAGPVHDHDGEIVGFRGIVRDVSARRATEERLETKSRELARSNEELRQFAYVASHDLQEPLRMVAGYTQLLARRYEGQLDEEADLFIRYAVEGVDRMQQLIRDLLDYSRVQTHGKRFERVDLGASVQWALSNLEGAIADADAAVTIDELPTIIGDATQMGQLFQNLLANAIKFRGDRPLEIHVGVQQRPGEWQISVRDNGIGIDPEYRTRVFEIFQRLHAPDEHEGTGIGLAICKRIVERHGGEIWVEAGPVQGATFAFTLPHDGSEPEGANDAAKEARDDAIGPPERAREASFDVSEATETERAAGTT